MDFPTSFSYSIHITKTRKDWAFKERRQEISSRETTARQNKFPNPCQKQGDKKNGKDVKEYKSLLN